MLKIKIKLKKYPFVNIFNFVSTQCPLHQDLMRNRELNRSLGLDPSSDLNDGGGYSGLIKPGGRLILQQAGVEILPKKEHI